MDRIRKTSTDDEEDISQDKESTEVVNTDMLEGESPCQLLKLSTESLLECLKNVGEIQPEPCSFDENANVRKTTRFVECEKVLSQYKIDSTENLLTSIFVKILIFI